MMYTLNIFMMMVPKARDTPREKNHSLAMQSPITTDSLCVGMANNTAEM